MKRNLFLWILSLAVLPSVLAGCAKEKPGGGQESGAAAGETSVLEMGESQTEGAETEGDGGMEVTVWLDAENEADVRLRLASYEQAKGSALEEYSQYYPDVQWDIVDKSSLTPEQYREELMQALEAGDGPDFIYMSEWNGVSPQGLMEAGSLFPLGDVSVAVGDKKMEYVKGALEAGTRDGELYALPLYMQCPILFGVEADLKEAGLRTEGTYGSLGEFLKALLAAQEKTGKLIFENADAVDWIEANYMPEDAAQAEEARGLLEEVRGRCGDDGSAYGAYQMLDAGECLLGGCGAGDCQALVRNLALFQEGQSPALLPLPDGGGGLRNVVTHAVGINAATAHPQEMLDMLHIFQGANGNLCPPGLDAYERIKSGITVEGSSAATLWANNAHSSIKWAEDRGDGFLSDSMAEKITDCCYGLADGASYWGGSAEGSGSAEEGGKPEEKEALTVYYSDAGDGEESPVTRLLEKAAEAYEAGDGGVHVQLIPRNEWSAMMSMYYHDMAKQGFAPDMALFDSATEATMSVNVKKADMRTADFGELFEECREELPALPQGFRDGIRYKNGATCLPVAAETFGLWYSRAALREAGLPEDWAPQGMEELTAGLEKLGGAAAMSTEENMIKAMALFASAPEEMLPEQEDGEYRTSEEAWAGYVRSLVEWRDNGLVRPADERQALEGFADGSLGAYLGGSVFQAWIDGGVLPLTEERKDDLAFVRLSPAVNPLMFFVPENSGHAEDAFRFWLEAVRLPEYGALMEECGYEPIAELGDDAISLPADSGKGGPTDLAADLWKDKTAEDLLGEKYRWFDYAGE